MSIWRKRFTRPRWAAVVVAAVTLGFGLAIPAASADNASGCDFAATGTTQSCVGPLSGSTFAGGDGNLLTSPTTFGTTDWQNVAGLNAGIDNPSGSSDNSFGQGTKEDNPNVLVVTGSIPPNKSDLTRFYEASEFAGGSNFLYLAWERTNVLGSANMDFEINQATTPGLGSPGPHTINRTAGDLLVTFDFTNGGGRPTLGLLTWVTSGPTSQCFSSNSLPCWGNHVDLNSSDSIGADVRRSRDQPHSGRSVPEGNVRGSRQRVPEEPGVGIVWRRGQGLRRAGRREHHQLRHDQHPQGDRERGRLLRLHDHRRPDPADVQLVERRDPLL